MHRDDACWGLIRPGAIPENIFVNTIGFDDAPFERDHRGDVTVVGVVCARVRVDGIVSTHVRRDGANATQRLAACIESSGFRKHLHAVLLQGIALAGFNVVDIHSLHNRLGLPVLVVARRRPRLALIRAALIDGLRPVRGGERKWNLIEHAGPMEPVGPVQVQRAGLSLELAAQILRATTLHGNLPEPLRIAHLIAGGITTGRSRGRA
jgi:endonuclease V-like protein UPF0215 family